MTKQPEITPRQQDSGPQETESWYGKLDSRVAALAAATLLSLGIGAGESSAYSDSSKATEKAPSGLLADKKADAEPFRGTEQYTADVFDDVWKGGRNMGIFNGLAIIDGHAKLYKHLDPKVLDRALLPLDDYYHKNHLLDGKFGSMYNPMVLVDHGTTWVGISQVSKNWEDVYNLRSNTYELPVEKQATLYNEMVWVPLTKHNAKYVKLYSATSTNHLPMFMHARINKYQADPVYGMENLNAVTPNGDYRALLPSQLAGWDLWKWTIYKRYSGRVDRLKVNEDGQGYPVFKPKSQLASYLHSIRAYSYYPSSKASKLPSPSKLEDMLNKLNPEYGIGD